MMQDSAENVALGALTWLATDQALFEVFLGSTGASVDDVKERAADPHFLAGVLEFILMDDDWVVACCDTLNLSYENLGLARQALPGGDLPNWT